MLLNSKNTNAKRGNKKNQAEEANLETSNKSRKQRFLKSSKNMNSDLNSAKNLTKKHNF